MVLEEAARDEFGSEDAFTSQDTPTSDANMSDGRAWSFDPNSPSYAKRLTLFGFRPMSQKQVADLSHMIDAFGKTFDRPIRFDERQALAEMKAKGDSINSYTYPIGIIAGALQAYRTMGVFKFPFRKVDPAFDPNTILGLRGQAARSLWHGLRFSSYVCFGVFFAGLLVPSYAIRTVFKRTMADPRLVDFHKDLERTKAVRPGRSAKAAAQAAEKARSMEQQEANPSGFRDADDMSPTAGAFASDVDEDSQTSRQSWSDLPKSTSSRDDSGSSGFDEYIGSNDKAAQQTPSSTKGRGGSWARLREQAKSGKDEPK